MKTESFFDRNLPSSSSSPLELYRKLVKNDLLGTHSTRWSCSFSPWEITKKSKLRVFRNSELSTKHNNSFLSLLRNVNFRNLLYLDDRFGLPPRAGLSNSFHSKKTPKKIIFSSRLRFLALFYHKFGMNWNTRRPVKWASQQQVALSWHFKAPRGSLVDTSSWSD